MKCFKCFLIVSTNILKIKCNQCYSRDNRLDRDDMILWYHVKERVKKNKKGFEKKKKKNDWILNDRRRTPHSSQTTQKKQQIRRRKKNAISIFDRKLFHATLIRSDSFLEPTELSKKKKSFKHHSCCAHQKLMGNKFSCWNFFFFSFRFQSPLFSLYLLY